MAERRINLDRLDKVLALVGSDKEGEAVAALRMARQMLGRAGLSFRDIFDPARNAAPAAAPDPPDPDGHSRLKTMILEASLKEARKELEKWNRLAREEKDLREQETAALAAEIETLRRARTEAPAGPPAGAPTGVPASPPTGAYGEAGSPLRASDRRRIVIDRLRDPETRNLSDRAIARQLGVSPQTVGNWRKRLAETAEQVSEAVRLVQRRGVTYWMRTGKIGQS